MNQLSLHQLLATNQLKKKKTTSPNELFDLRLATNSTLIKNLFFSLYPESEHTATFEKLLSLLTQLFQERPEDLKKIDLERLKNGNWYQSEQMMGMQLYVDHFNKDIKGLSEKIGYFEDLGVNFLHLMPITKRPKEENDGGYAVNSYHEVDKKYGTKEDLLTLTKKLRSKNMYLMLDFVVNHTSDEFEWAKKAMKGDKKYQEYYYTFPDRTIPDQFEETLPEVFPETNPGNFTYNHDMKRWVMTVFNSYQWDLNYANPEVFLEMLGNLMKLTNMGVDVVRFDALAFLWKKMGTDSQNLPEAHQLIALFRMCLQTVAPGVILLAEAIVSPTQIIKYFGEGDMKGNECEVAYNATLMALLWNSMATKKTVLLYKSLQYLPQKPKEATWINYIRCHDDIGLGFDDNDIYSIGWDAKEHRKFLLHYYCQKLDWSPAKGLMFMYNPKNGDGRITGSAASLLGLEKGLEQQDEKLVSQAIAKIITMHSIILSYGGMPLIYAGDEIGTLNDYSYQKENSKKDDSRWVNRPKQDWDAISHLEKGSTPQSHIYHSLRKLIGIRKNNPIFADQNNLILHQHHNPHLLIYERTSADHKNLLVICNFDDHIHGVEKSWMERVGYGEETGIGDLVTEQPIHFQSNHLEIGANEFYWIVRN
ncbi:alpha-amylase family protein [Sediminicola sp. 1XM1-17]|uniref:alpha-amylase family protein n=1 Tax=Sediminicola sp. 1XM1-17 TaxID=3127702 RepID=UPI003077ACB5